MKIISPSAVIETHTVCLNEVLELAGRTCWKSEDKVEPGSAEPFLDRIMNFKHESVLEHGAITVRFICDRGVSHELVRHRLASFSQESTRYCNYDKDKFGREITLIDIRGGFPDMNPRAYDAWHAACSHAESLYFEMLSQGSTPQEARSVLPNSLKTEVVMTTNPREWRHIFRLRCDKAAHPQMREIMIPLWRQFAEMWPVLFAGIEFAGRPQ